MNWWGWGMVIALTKSTHWKHLGAVKWSEVWSFCIGGHYHNKLDSDTEENHTQLPISQYSNYVSRTTVKREWRCAPHSPSLRERRGPHWGFSEAWGAGGASQTAPDWQRGPPHRGRPPSLTTSLTKTKQKNWNEKIISRSVNNEKNSDYLELWCHVHQTQNIYNSALNLYECWHNHVWHNTPILYVTIRSFNHLATYMIYFLSFLKSVIHFL